MWWIPLAAAETVDVAPPSADGPVRAVSPRHLLVTIDEDTAFSRTAGDWSLACGGDIRRGTELSVRTRAVSLIPEGWPFTAVLEHEVVIGLDGTLPTGDCTVTGGGYTADVALDPEVLWTPA